MLAVLLQAEERVQYELQKSQDYAIRSAKRAGKPKKMRVFDEDAGKPNKVQVHIYL